MRGDPDDCQKPMVVSFIIPELGISFKAPFDGGQDETDFASLLALLEFVDLNRKLFGDKALQIFGNNVKVVRQVNDQRAFEDVFQPFITRAISYRNKYRFSLEWTPTKRNRALYPRVDTPPNPPQ